MIKVHDTKLKGVKLIEPSIFKDHRGEYIETYNEKLYRELGITIKFVQDDISVSSKNVLRGLHGDDKTWKLVSCAYGEFMLAVVNFDCEANQYLEWETFVLSDRNRLQVLVPPKFANGHLVLSEQAIFSYKQSTYYQPDSQFTIRWNDPKIGIRWSIENPVLSKRDASAPFMDR